MKTKFFGATTIQAVSCLTLAAAALLVINIAGCKKEPQKPPTVKVSIRSQPGEVNVKVISHGNQNFGVTPRSREIPPGVYVLEFSKPGYETTWKKLSCIPGKDENIEIKLNPLSTSVIIESDPQGATVSQDNAPVGETPLALHNLPIGIHTYTINKPGFSTRELRFSLDDERPKLIEVNMSSNIGTMVVRSTPSNANILINGDPRGQTPASITLEQGEYDLELQIEGHVPQKEKVIVSRGGTVRVNTTLQVIPSSLNIVTDPPGANLTVNGKQYNDTPTKIENLPPGTYSITVTHPNYDSETREVAINPGQNINVEMKLDSIMGGADLIIHPPGITVYLNGKEIGATERGETDKLSKVFRIREVPSGAHTITLAHKRAEPPEISFKINITKGQISRPKPYTFWVKDTYLKLKNGQELTGRINHQNEREVHFEHSPQIRVRYDRNEIDVIRELKDTE